MHFVDSTTTLTTWIYSSQPSVQCRAWYRLGIRTSVTTLCQLSIFIKWLQRQTPSPSPCHLPFTSGSPALFLHSITMLLTTWHTRGPSLCFFFGFLHCSEFNSSTIKFRINLHLCNRNLHSVSKEYLTFSLKWSKTNQSGSPTFVILFKTNLIPKLLWIISPLPQT